MIKNILIAVGLSFLIGGCAVTNAVTQMDQNPDLSFWQAISNATNEDLDAAITLAGDDIVAVTCYKTLKKYVGKAPTEKTPIKGAFSAFQKARNIKGKVDTGIPADLQLGCAALVQDVRAFALKMAAIGGTAGVLAPIAGQIGAVAP